MNPTLSAEQQAAYVKDLIKKYPAGPNGQLKKDDYEISWEYCDLYERTRRVPVYKEGGAYGYDPVDLWRLVSGDASDLKCRSLIRETYGSSISRVAESRRAKALRSKIKQSVQDVQIVGTEGTYKLRWGYYTTKELYTYAKSKQEAKSTASVLAGLFGHDMNEDVSVTFVTIESPEKTQQRNNSKAESLLSQAQNAVKQAELRLEEAKKSQDIVKKMAGLLMTAASMQEVIQDVSNQD